MSIGCKGQEIAEIGEMYDAGIVGISDGDEFTEFCRIPEKCNDLYEDV